MSHPAKAVLMIKPTDFEYNFETALDNEFMHVDANPSSVKELALNEFKNTVRLLQSAGILVIAFDKTVHYDLQSEKMPDAVFPNNWFSTDCEGRVIIYPMAAASRNREKQAFRFIMEDLARHRFKVTAVVNFGSRCDDNAALEGTGALIIDRRKKRVYCSLSKRADDKLLEEWAKEFGYEAVAFDTKSSNGKPFYHTNVVLSIGDRFAVVCDEAIPEKDRDRVLGKLREDREVITITLAQAEKNFCANMLELSNAQGKSIFAMSQSAYEGFTEQQRSKLMTFGDLLPCPIPVIEKVGGGSVRCMLAEIFLPMGKED